MASDTTPPFDEEVDLLVIGAGAAGMTAALVGSIEGLRTLVCEKDRDGGRHHLDVGRHRLDSGQHPKPPGRHSGLGR